VVSNPFTFELALLGFLRQRTMYPYEIYLLLSQAHDLGRVWHMKQSQLYATLGRLRDAGYIDETLEANAARPPRRVMSLTPSGQMAFYHWLTTPVEHGRDFRLEFLAKLYFVRKAGPLAARDLIEKQAAVCHSWLADLAAEAARLVNERQYDWLVVQFRINQIQGILTWLDTCDASLNQPSPTELTVFS
jgi:DNA-binding PadR family transcriptional regulator